MEQLNVDIKQYNTVINAFNELDTNNIDLAYKLAKRCLILANRWNEIMLNSVQYANEAEISKTTFEKWAYHKYRVLMTIHEFCRCVWRQGKEEYRISNQYE